MCTRTTASATPSPPLPFLVVPRHEVQQLLLCCGGAATTTTAPRRRWPRPSAPPPITARLPLLLRPAPHGPVPRRTSPCLVSTLSSSHGRATAPACAPLAAPAPPLASARRGPGWPRRRAPLSVPRRPRPALWVSARSGAPAPGARRL